MSSPQYRCHLLCNNQFITLSYPFTQLPLSLGSLRHHEDILTTQTTSSNIRHTLEGHWWNSSSTKQVTDDITVVRQIMAAKAGSKKFCFRSPNRPILERTWKPFWSLEATACEHSLVSGHMTVLLPRLQILWTFQALNTRCCHLYVSMINDSLFRGHPQALKLLLSNYEMYSKCFCHWPTHEWKTFLGQDKYYQPTLKYFTWWLETNIFGLA